MTNKAGIVSDLCAQFARFLNVARANGQHRNSAAVPARTVANVASLAVFALWQTASRHRERSQERQTS